MEYTKHQQIEFDCYGTKITGRFLDYQGDGMIQIEVIKDSSDVWAEGEIVEIHEAHQNKAITI